MKTALIEQNLPYDGTQLSSHFAYGQLGILGDSAVAFIGPCQVDLAQMVDLEDVRNQAPIYSPKMLHFILELFHWELSTAVVLQRLLVAALREALQAQGVEGLERRGDDLYQGERKLNVSIATASPVSCLIHLGINIQTKGTPVPTIGLEELGVEPETFAKHCLEIFQQEYFAIQKASYKVKPVR